jgi:hypothetical protein
MWKDLPTLDAIERVCFASSDSPRCRVNRLTLKLNILTVKGKIGL